MNSLRFLAFLALTTVLLASFAFAQAPTITSIGVKTTGCYYKVGSTSKTCSIGPGMTVNINGSNFGKTPGVVSFCGCPQATVVSWSASRVTVTVNSIAPNSALSLETVTGLFSNAISYNALAPLITSIAVGNCTYTPNTGPYLCKITPGTQFTVNGSYFGPPNPYSVVVTCTACGGGAATIISWDPNWQTSPSPYNNQIVAVADMALCGYTVAVYANGMWSNYVAYTAC